jgi:glycine/serine hydroxymethyltransferase
MGIPEMKKIAEFIGRAVKSENAAEHAQIKTEVSALTSAFPAYPRS